MQVIGLNDIGLSRHHTVRMSSPMLGFDPAQVINQRGLVNRVGHREYGAQGAWSQDSLDGGELESMAGHDVRQ